MRKKWADVSNGPDVLDATTIMQAIGSLHSAHVALIASPGTGGSGTTVDLALSALFDVLPGSSLPAGIGVHSEWPNKKGTSFWGEVYNLCWMLDEEISKAYKQERVWK